MTYFERTSHTLDLRYVACVSWPRSGHHLLVRLCEKYFESDFGYCEFYGSEYPCCRNFPCQKQSQIKLSKNHDHDLHLDFDGSAPLLIQIRAFEPSVVSNFELAVRNGAPDTRESFENFALEELAKFNQFSEKWCQRDYGCERLIVQYEDLVDRPLSTLSSITSFLAPSHTPDPQRMKQAISSVDGETVERGKTEVRKEIGVHKSRCLREFRFYSDVFFTHLKSASACIHHQSM